MIHFVLSQAEKYCTGTNKNVVLLTKHSSTPFKCTRTLGYNHIKILLLINPEDR